MKSLRLAPWVALLVAGAALAGPRLVRMRLDGPDHLDALRESGAYELLELYPDGTADLVEDPDLLREQMGRLAPMLSGRTVRMRDLDAVFAPFRAMGSEGAYHNVDEVNAEIHQLAAAHPERLAIEEIGRSIEDRPIYAVRVGRRDGVERPAGVFMSMIHAREWITTELGMAFLHRLAEPDEDLAPVLEGVDLWVVPVLNPDGLEWSQSQFRWWRGNRRPHGNGRFGVDLNRNWPVGWGIGSSSIPGSQTYRGSEPLSEPENQAFEALVARVKPVVTMTFHAYGRMVLRPYGYQNPLPAREDLFSAHGLAMQADTGYRTGPISRLIGRVGGSTDDHFVETHGAFAMSLELGDQFIPPQNQISEVVEGAMPAAMRWVRAIPELAGIDPREEPSTQERAFEKVHGQ